MSHNELTDATGSADGAAPAAVGPLAQVAGPYADAGMATTPAKGKAAFLPGWQNGTPEASRAHVAQHGHLNVGVLAGDPSGVAFLDDDTGDPEVDQTIEEFWPSPWRRVGSKGSARAYAHSGLGTFRIKDKNGKALIEHLSTGTQLIVPPSIHPDTKRPYVATSDLPAVKPALTTLPADIETRLRRKLTELGYELEAGGGGKAAAAAAPTSGVIAEGGRDDALCREAGKLRRIGLVPEEIELVLLAMNERRCRPPLPDDEVRGIARSVGRYEPTKTYASTEFGVAQRFLDDLDGYAAWCGAFGWLVYDGRRWLADDGQEIPKRAQETVRAIEAEAGALADEKQRKDALAFARFMQKAKVVDATLKLAKPHLAVDAAGFDRDPYLFNVENGTIDLRTGELRPHRRDDMLRRIAPVTYDPAAGCPIFDRFMSRIMGGDQGMVEFLYRALGSALLGTETGREFFVFHGAGRNGKSTLLRLAHDMLGDYAVQATSDLFLLKKFETIPNDVARLAGARLVTASETKAGGGLDAARVKLLTGGDPVSARFLHKELFTFQPVFTPLLATNFKPVIDGGDKALMDRIKMVPFKVRIPDDEVDLELPAKLRAEAPGVLARLVKGCLDYRRGGLEPPAKVTEATDDYAEEMDEIGDFIARCAVRDPKGKAKMGELAREYRNWCMSQLKRSMTGRTFGRRVTDWLERWPEVVKAKSDIVVFRGIRVMTKEEARERDKREGRA